MSSAKIKLKYAHSFFNLYSLMIYLGLYFAINRSMSYTKAKSVRILRVF